MGQREPLEGGAPLASASASLAELSDDRIRWTGVGRQAIGPAGDAEVAAPSASRSLLKTIVPGLEDYCLGAIAALMSRDAAGRARRCGLYG